MIDKDNADDVNKTNKYSSSPLKSSLKGGIVGVIVSVIFGIVMILWAQNKGRIPYGGWDAFFLRFLIGTIVFSIWCGTLGLFFHPLPKKYGNDYRALWSGVSVFIGAFIPFLAIYTLDRSANWLTGAVVMGCIGGFFSGLFTLARQFDKDDKTVSAIVEKKDGQ